MNWFFGRKKKEKNAQLEQLQDDITTMNDQMKDMAEQVTKLTRVQFKSTKKMEEKLDGAVADQNKQETLLTENQHYEKQQAFISQQLMQLLDELDHVASGIHNREQSWYDLLAKWSQTLTQSLEAVGMYEVNVFGKSFDPKAAESIRTVEKNTLAATPIVAYQVVEVLQRGYVTKDGQLIRKAKVVTVKEEQDHVQ